VSEPVAGTFRGVGDVHVGTCSWTEKTMVDLWYPKGVTSPEQRLRYYASKFGTVEVDFEKAEVIRDGVQVPLTGKELELLRYLVDHRGNVVAREELLESVWQYQPGVSSRTIDVHVAWLRQKLEVNPASPKYIHTVRGVGYRFSA